MLLTVTAVSAQSPAKQTATLQGRIIDDQSRTPLGFATAMLKGAKTYTVAAGEGGMLRIEDIEPGTYVATFSFVAYQPRKLTLTFVRGEQKTITVRLKPTDHSLGEVTITANERVQKTSTSWITREAMQHLQPTSFADLMELLPGGKSYDPAMTQSQMPYLREPINMNGSSKDANMTIATLGVGVQIDGMNLNNDVNLQTLRGSYAQGDAGGSTVNQGIDLRAIPTDEIESVEVIRGIPSVEYGNVTGGVFKVNRIRTATPVRARFKADLYGQLFAASKGIQLTRNDVLNVGADFLHSNADPSNSLINYKRITASARWNANRRASNGMQYRWSVNTDYTGTIDKKKVNPDDRISQNRYSSDYNQLSLNTNAELTAPARWLLQNIRFNLSAQQEWSKIEQWQKENGDIFIPTATPPTLGTYVTPTYVDAPTRYFPYGSVSHSMVDGKPLVVDMSLTASFQKLTGAFNHKFRIGGEYNYSRNFGRGDIYDPDSIPLNRSFYRPRAFKDYPALQNAALYGELVEKLLVGGHQIELTAGLRMNTMPGVSDRYKLSGHWYADPRFNLMWLSPAINDNLRFDLAISAGWLTRMPTLSQLYPNPIYRDADMVVYSDEEGVKAMTRSYAWDNTNYDIEPTRNFKWEVRGGFVWNNHRLSVTYYRERMDNAFRSYYYWTHTRSPRYNKDEWKEAGFPTDLSKLTPSYYDALDVYSRQGNDAQVRKEGVEFQYTSPRIRPIYTGITVNGAWMRASYYYMGTTMSAMQLQGGGSPTYVALYGDYRDGYDRDMFRTNFILDTQVPKMGLIVSLNFQCEWFTNRESPRYNAAPYAYIVGDGIEKEYTEADQKDPLLSKLMARWPANKMDEPFAMTVNLKASKDISKFLRASLFVNRIIDFNPDYHNDYGTLIRRSIRAPYFGMEATLTF